METATPHDPRPVSLREIASTFLLIGATGFGGGMAVIALIQDMCVGRRHWLTREEFSHGIAFGQILGPFAVNASTFVGYRLRGLAGALTAVLAFLTPSVVLVVALSALYFRFHSLPSLQSALRGIGPVVVALILSAAYQMGRGTVSTAETVLTAIVALGLLLLGVQVIWILLAAVVYGTIRYLLTARRPGSEA